jgi:hypothetical protein
LLGAPNGFQGPQTDDIAGIQYLYGSRDTAPIPPLAAIPVPAAFWMLLSGVGLLSAAAFNRSSIPQPMAGHSPRYVR